MYRNDDYQAANAALTPIVAAEANAEEEIPFQQTLVLALTELQIGSTDRAHALRESVRLRLAQQDAPASRAIQSLLAEFEHRSALGTRGE